MSQASDYASRVSDILQNKAAAIAEGKRTSGQILGNTIATLGQVVPQQVQAAMHAAAQKRKEAQIHGIFQKYPGDLDSAINEILPIDQKLANELMERNNTAKKTAMEFQTAQTNAKMAQEKAQREADKAKQDFLVRTYGAATDDDSWTQAGLAVHHAGIEDPYAGTKFDPKIRDSVLMSGMDPDKAYERLHPKPNLMSLGGGAVMDANTQQMVREASLTPDQKADNERMAAAEARQASAQAAATRIAQGHLDVDRAQLGLSRERLNADKAGAGASGIPPEYELALRGVTIDLPNVRRANLNTAAKMAYEQGGEKALAEVVARAAIDTEPVAARTQILGRRETLQALDDAAVVLKQLKDKGISTGILRGTVEDVARKLGTSTNPELVRLATRLKNTEANYRRSITGAQFGEKEAADYAKMFPNYSNTLPVNLSLIEGLRDAMGSYDKSYWKHKLGTEMAQKIGVIPGGSGPQGKATAGPKNDPMGIR